MGLGDPGGKFTGLWRVYRGGGKLFKIQIDEIHFLD
jgi:hypothetical protein